MRGARSLLLCITAAFLVEARILFDHERYIGRAGGGTQLLAAQTTSIKAHITGLPVTSFAPIVEATQAAIVSVVAASNSSGIVKIPGVGTLFRDSSPRKSMGSGAIFTRSGLVITNFHVIDEPNATLTVKTSNGRRYRAQPVVSDHVTDLAVLRIGEPVDGLPKTKDFTPIVIGDATRSRVGDIVLAMGNNLGFAGTVTAGMISAIGRSMTESESLAKKSRPTIEGAVSGAAQPFIQTDAAVNVGSSGGALVNTDGELVGINTAIVSPGKGSGNVGVAFAIPSNLLHPIIKAAMEGKPLLWPVDGIIELTRVERGLRVDKIKDPSPACTANMRVNDTLTAIDVRAVRVPLSTVAGYKMLLTGLNVSDTYQYDVIREGKAAHIDVKLDGQQIPIRDARSDNVMDALLDGSASLLQTRQRRRHVK